MTISTLDPTEPSDIQPAGQGAAEIRGTKLAVKTAFPAVNAQISNAGAGGGAADTNPPDAATFSKLFADVRGLTGLTSAVPVGGIIMWAGALVDIPSGWALCDGAAGTPNLTDRFVIGQGTYSQGSTGGSFATGSGGSGASVTVTIPPHTITENHIPGHSHKLFESGVETGARVQPGATDTVYGVLNVPGTGAGYEMDYAVTKGSGAAPTVGKTSDYGASAAVATLTHDSTTATIGGHTHTILPSYYALAFIIFQG